MNSNLLFDFIVNKETKTIHIDREFDSTLDLVWQAWTTAELLDQWWAPAPLRNLTISMDFRVGSYWLYTMLDEKGEIIRLNDEEIYAKWTYLSIVDKISFTVKDGFCYENGTIKTAYPQNLWKTMFLETNNRVLVSIISSFDKLEDLEQTIEMGFKEGFTAGLNKLDELLTSLNK